MKEQRDLVRVKAGAETKPRVILLGRPNVGKSTLFNLLTRKPRAIVHNQEGVTRDWLTGTWRIQGYPPLELYDLCGFREHETDPLLALAQKEHRKLVEQASLVLLVLDGRAGLTSEEEWLKEWLTKLGVPVLGVVNKMDHPGLLVNLGEFARLGLPLLPISAAHRRGIEALEEEVISTLGLMPEGKEEDLSEGSQESLPCLAIMGRPNVGKSTLFNALLGYERSLVSPLPGTTRDYLEMPVEIGGVKLILLDTAGIRRRTRVKDELEKASVRASLKAAGRANIILYLLDPLEGISEQDQRLILRMMEKGKGLILIYARWDLVSDPAYQKRILKEQLEMRLGGYEYLPRLFLSVHKGYGMEELPRWIARLHTELHRRIPTSRVNQALTRIFAESPPLPLPSPGAGKPRALKVYYGTQVGTNPLRFQIFTNLREEEIPQAYHRFLEKRLRKALGFHHVPILLLWERKESS